MSDFRDNGFLDPVCLRPGDIEARKKQQRIINRQSENFVQALAGKFYSPSLGSQTS